MSFLISHSNMYLNCWTMETKLVRGLRITWLWLLWAAPLMVHPVIRSWTTLGKYWIGSTQMLSTSRRELNAAQPYSCLRLHYIAPSCLRVKRMFLHSSWVFSARTFKIMNIQKSLFIQCNRYRICSRQWTDFMEAVPCWTTISLT